MIEFKNVSFAYNASVATQSLADSTLKDAVKAPESLSQQEMALTLDNVSFTLNPGSRTVVLGHNGSGKSTLANLCNASLFPLSGEILVDDNSTAKVPSTQISSVVGMVRQDPTAQLVCATVFDEVAFGPANLGLPKEDIVSRVTQTLELCGIADLVDAPTHTLSGGQQQLVAIAAALSLQPNYLVLDEAFSQLDTRFRNHLSKLVNNLVANGIGVLEISHSFESLPGADQVLVLEKSHLVWAGTPTEFLSDARAISNAGFDDALTATAHQAAQAGYDFDTPLSVSELVLFLVQNNLALDTLDSLVYQRALEVVRANNYDGIQALGEAHELAICGVSHAFDKPVLHDVSLSSMGELVVLVGASGSGKTTCARVAAGLIEADVGHASIDARLVSPGDVGICFQRPQDQLFAKSVAEDIAFGPSNKGFSPDDVEKLVAYAAERVGLDQQVLDASPLTLSGGQARRTALAGTLACATYAVVFDEATSGLDGEARLQMLHLARELANEGKAVLAITHDVSEWLPFADRVVFLEKGCVVANVSVQEAQTNPQVYKVAQLDCPLFVSVLHELLEACHV